MQSQLKELVTHYQKALLIKRDNLAVYEKIAALYYQHRELEKVLGIFRKAQFPPLPTQGGFLTGEATPWYLGGYEIEKKVSQLFPKIKLIAILRNPVTRAISNYYMSFKMMKEHRSLEVAINSEIEILTGITDTDDIIEKYWQTEKGYLWFSLYFYFFLKWMAVFPREQFLILRAK